VQWAGTHRYHHATADTALDPHSPVQRGFLYAHVGWYLRSGNPVLCLAYAAGGPARMLVDAWMRPRTNQEHNALAEDVSADRWYRFISRPWPYAVAMHLHAGISLWLAHRWWGAAGVLGIWLTLAALYNAGDAIDSVAHVFGRKLEKQPPTNSATDIRQHQGTRRLARQGARAAAQAYPRCRPGSHRRKTKTPTTALVLLGASGARGRAQLVTRKEAQRLWRA